VGTWRLSLGEQMDTAEVGVEGRVGKKNKN